MRNIQVGVIGAGRIGRVHAQHLKHRIPGVKLAAVSDVIQDAATQLAGELDIPAVFTDHRRILEDKNIQAVAICSSTDTHARFIIEAAQAGKHIFCEKPIAHHLADIDQALEAVEQASVKLQIGFNRRFDPNFKRVQEVVASGKIGTPNIMHIISRDPQPPPIEYIKVSGGIFLDQTIHDFDMARFLIDSEVDEIFAVGGVMVDPAIGQAGDIDTAVITLRYRNGVIGTIDNSRRAVYGYDQRVEVFGSGGSVMVSNNKPNTSIISDANGVTSSLPLFFFMDRYIESYINEMQVFIECVRKDETPPVTGIDGRIPVVMGIAAKKSYMENRPVKLSEIEAV
ncbi:MAG: inositol 2-dehydrogenase [Anaerolineales bacterium]|nr:inositol 2-dehydrogenase [Anaerolineales bacterium]